MSYYIHTRTHTPYVNNGSLLAFVHCHHQFDRCSIHFKRVPNRSHSNTTLPGWPLVTSCHLYPHTSAPLPFQPHQSPRARGLAAGQMGQSKSRPFPPFRLPSCFRLRIGHEEVAEHKEGSDCWVIIGDLVLDLSKYVAKHPGGKQSILKLAGGDATEIFDLVHHRSILKKHGLQEGTITLKGVVSG